MLTDRYGLRHACDDPAGRPYALTPGPSPIRERGGPRLALAAALAACVLVPSAHADDRMSRVLGEALFERAWVPAPSSTRANDGLGPLFNARACVSCHVGLVRAPTRVGADGVVTSETLVLRLSDAAGRPDPVYGTQIQTAAVPGFAPDGLLRRTPGGYAPHGLARGALAATTRTGARIAPALRGLGRLEAVPDAVLAAAADPEDRDGDGISGRFVGRFGHKAQARDLAEMTAIAFAADLGMSTTHRPAAEGDCPTCRAAPHGGTPEIVDEIVGLVAAYLAAVPPPPEPAPDAAGARLFAETGCAACHAPALASPDGEVRAYTNLLVHDLGPGLDGGATEPGIAPGEWRTAPLWGLSRALADGAGLLHDGRAATVAEAIAAHGGEAAGARTAFDRLAAGERARLLRFVEGL
ncbi:di-heme oxidoredictase family protein [Salinarimonas rosea]|uniref:di-heme oxidoredictase family protein n=1 Tax=Salinarimonas rosea TaxID=552063 RepID=UPI000418A3FB|nr:di-heme oxidoredictase family protein [Salinarimonas rosea]